MSDDPFKQMRKQINFLRNQEKKPLIKPIHVLFGSMCINILASFIIGICIMVFGYGVKIESWWVIILGFLAQIGLMSLQSAIAKKFIEEI